MRRKFPLLLTCALIVACNDQPLPVAPTNGPNIPGVRKTDLYSGDNIQTAIDAWNTNDPPIWLHGTFNVAGHLLIQNKTGLYIRGDGQGSTTINFQNTDTLNNIGFEIGNGVHTFDIAHMSIRGNAGVQAIAMHEDTSAVVSDLTFTDLDIRDVRVGISVYGASDRGSGTCNNVTMYHNYLEHMIGTTPGGRGYGLHNDGCTNVRITENEIRSAGRHSIYQAHGRGPVTIDHNLIINHRCEVVVSHTCPGLQVAGNENLVALVVARTANVVVAHNVILNPWADAISVELDDQSSLDTKNVRLIHNTVWNTHARDLFFTALQNDTVQTWGNVFIHSGDTAPTSPTLRPSTPTSTIVSPTARWIGTQVFDAVKDGNVHNAYPYSFVMQNNYLHEVNTSYNQNFDNASYWTYTGVTLQNFSGFTSMVAGNGVAYVMNGSTLTKLTPNRTGTQTTWPSSASPDTWTGAKGIAWTTNSDPSDVGSVFVQVGSALYQVNPSTWGRTQGTTNWTGTQAVTSYNDHAYVMQNNTIHLIRASLSALAADYLDYWY